ncbi:hypothetical protein AVEN_119484-1 [Araneus ventricosus]|uniref:Uncharacterized protein n=1 Tax=Araneus ventricosus TaxID=182803 RepID=A0A4Y2W9Z8_ARAVE|nr:hypothetical protein AVEN_119484-1 [Araneus ventricosus]
MLPLACCHHYLHITTIVALWLWSFVDICFLLVVVGLSCVPPNCGRCGRRVVYAGRLLDIIVWPAGRLAGLVWGCWSLCGRRVWPAGRCGKTSMCMACWTSCILLLVFIGRVCAAFGRSMDNLYGLLLVVGRRVFTAVIVLWTYGPAVLGCGMACWSLWSVWLLCYYYYWSLLMASLVVCCGRRVLGMVCGRRVLAYSNCHVGSCMACWLGGCCACWVTGTDHLCMNTGWNLGCMGWIV